MIVFYYGLGGVAAFILFLVALFLVVKVARYAYLEGTELFEQEHKHHHHCNGEKCHGNQKGQERT